MITIHPSIITSILKATIGTIFGHSPLKTCRICNPPWSMETALTAPIRIAATICLHMGVALDFVQQVTETQHFLSGILVDVRCWMNRVRIKHCFCASLQQRITSWINSESAAKLISYAAKLQFRRFALPDFISSCPFSMPALGFLVQSIQIHEVLDACATMSMCAATTLILNAPPYPFAFVTKKPLDVLLDTKGEPSVY